MRILGVHMTASDLVAGFCELAILAAFVAITSIWASILIDIIHNKP